MLPGVESYDLHDLAHVSRVGSVLQRSCIQQISYRQVHDLDDLDDLQKIMICSRYELMASLHIYNLYPLKLVLV